MKKLYSFLFLVLFIFSFSTSFNYAQSGKNYLNVDGTVKDSFFVGKKHNFAMLFDRSQKDSLKQNTIATWDTVKKVWVKSEGLKSLQDSIVFHRYEMNMYSTKIDQNATDIDFQAGRIGRHDDSIYFHRTQLNVNADSIKSLVTKTSVHDGKLTQQQAELNVQAGEISLRVRKDSIISYINQTPETITIEASKIALNGDVIIKNINGNSDGTSISAGKIKTTDITALGNVTAGSFNLGNGTFSVIDGILTAKSANFSGSITGSTFTTGQSVGALGDRYQSDITSSGFMVHEYNPPSVISTSMLGSSGLNVSITASGIEAETSITAQSVTTPAISLNGNDLQTTLNGKASTSHSHATGGEGAPVGDPGNNMTYYDATNNRYYVNFGGSWVEVHP